MECLGRETLVGIQPDFPGGTDGNHENAKDRNTETGPVFLIPSLDDQRPPLALWGQDVALGGLSGSTDIAPAIAHLLFSRV